MFSIFNRKRHIIETGLLVDSADIHNHLLPGVDDGIQTAADSMAAFRGLHEMGVSRFFLTPHVMEDLSNTRASLEKRFKEFKPSIPKELTVKLAAEYMLDAGFAVHVEEGLLTMGYDRQVLVETSYMSPPPGMMKMLYELTLRGYTPIIAHPERYVYMMPHDYELLKSKGYRFQLNYLSLAGFYGKPVYVRAHDLLKSRMYDYTGSDFHHLDKHRWGLGHLELTKSETEMLRTLFANNKFLF